MLIDKPRGIILINQFSDQQKIKIARNITKKQPMTKAAITKAIGADALKLLTELKLVNEIQPTGRARAVKYEYTAEAKELFSKVEIPKLKRKGRRTKPTTLDLKTLQPLVLQIMNPYFESLEKRISSLEETLVSSSVVKEDKSTSIFDANKFLDDLKHHYDWINTRERKGGMVPIPGLWDMLKKDGYKREDFENGLFELEKNRTIDLQVASDHKLLKEPEKAIKHSKRGYINYVVWRR